MPRTAGSFKQDVGPSDGQLFVTASDFQIAAGAAPNTVVNAYLAKQVAPAGSATLLGYLSEILRTGALASAGPAQQQFGTAANVPGPSAVAGTTNASGLIGYPPLLAANNPTLHGPVTGPVPKGVQFNYLDVIYQTTGAALTSFTANLSIVSFPLAGGSAGQNILIPAQYNLSLAVSAGILRTRIPVAVPAYSVTDGASPYVGLTVATPAGSTFTFYGMVLGVSFNYN
jgi:hypothetical protein